MPKDKSFTRRQSTYLRQGCIPSILVLFWPQPMDTAFFYATSQEDGRDSTIPSATGPLIKIRPYSWSAGCLLPVCMPFSTIGKWLPLGLPVSPHWTPSSSTACPPRPYNWAMIPPSVPIVWCCWPTAMRRLIGGMWAIPRLKLPFTTAAPTA